MANERSLGGVVLAGGRGRRFGRPKAVVEIGGVTLAQLAVDALRPFCTSIVVATRSDLDLVVDHASVTFDSEGPACALNGIRSGLRALDTDDALVLACDLAVDRSVLHLLAMATSAVVTEPGDHGPQPLCARYPRTDALRACDDLIAADELRARSLPRRLDALVMAVDEASIVNINTVADAEAVARTRRGCDHEGP